MKFRAVLFDAAETLFTTRGSVGEIYHSVARQYGSSATAGDVQAAFTKHFRGAGPLSVEDQKNWWRDIVHRVYTDVGMVRNFDEFFDRVYDKFRDSQGWILFPETLDVLQQLRDMNVKMGIISNFDSRIYSVLDSLEIRGFFEAVILSSETGYSKPDPQIFQAAIGALDVPAGRILLVGDSINDDVRAGIRAGLAAVWLDRKARDSSGGPFQTVSSLAEIPALVLEPDPGDLSGL
jgi:putative hydrolase of the HAD superfamily